MKIKNKQSFILNTVILLFWIFFLITTTPSEKKVINIPTNMLLGLTMSLVSIVNIYKSLDLSKQSNK